MSAPAYRVRNWSEFQHYRDRNPPWIKLHRQLLDDCEYHAADAFTAKYLPLAWLLASEQGGDLPALPQMAFRLRLSLDDCRRFVDAAGHWLERVDSTALADCAQPAIPRALARDRDRDREETETETETEAENTPRADAGARTRNGPSPAGLAAGTQIAGIISNSNKTSMPDTPAALAPWGHAVDHATRQGVDLGRQMDAARWWADNDAAFGRPTIGSARDWSAERVVKIEACKRRTESQDGYGRF